MNPYSVSKYAMRGSWRRLRPTLYVVTLWYLGNRVDERWFLLRWPASRQADAWRRERGLAVAS